MTNPTLAFQVDFARQAHADIAAAAARGNRALAARGLADHHYHEVWERASETVVSRTRISQRAGRYRLVGLACTAGQSWGGA